MRYEMTEDEVRDQARSILDLEASESAQAGVGQLTSFNKLGFPGIKDRPDGFFAINKIDKPLIYSLTRSINDILHFNFVIKNLYHRMIFTACALVAKRYGAHLFKGMSFALFATSIRETLTASFSADLVKNMKLQTLLDVFSEIKLNANCSQDSIDNFIEDVSRISDNINSDFWNGEDVMAIFFNEFNRYKAKSESGQVFTPDHITSFMYRITNTSHTDYMLDAACGSGAFLIKAMCNMIKEVGGVRTKRAVEIAQASCLA